jgi:hypothetical protein
MKKFLVVTCICMVTVIQVGCARQTGKSVMIDKVKSVNISYINDVNNRAARDFVKRYDQAIDPNWYKAYNGYIVKFRLNNNIHRAAYNEWGDWTYTIQYYKEESMPKDIRAIVKRVYYDYTITQVEEIKTPNQPVTYLVHMQDATTWRNVKVCDNDMETVELLNKSR